MSTAWTNQVTSLIILTEQTTGFSGLFGYSPSAGAGNLIFSLAAKAGTDPYGNAYPQGLSTTLGSISGTTFNGTDFTIDPSGEFFYSGTPANGNLVVSIAQAAGTDGFGNAYQSGITDYSGANIWTQLQAGVINLNGAAGQFQTGQLGTSGSGTTFLSSGLETNADVGAEVIAQSADAAGGSSTVTISAADFQVNNNATISGTLTVNGTDLGSLVAAIVGALSGASTSTNGVANGQTTGTSGGASAGTAHTHGAGSYALTSGQHSHTLPIV